MSTKPHSVTVKMLKAKDACKEQVRLFRDIFGEKAEFTPENQEKAERAGLDMSWFYRVFKLTGEVVSYYPDGKVEWSENYKNGEPHGKTVSYYPDGMVEFRRVYQNGKRHGETAWYYKDGTVKYRENYNNGELHGKTVGYYSNGTVAYRDNYNNGELIKE